MRAFAALLNLVVAQSLRNDKRWEEESWYLAYQYELPNAEGKSEIDIQEEYYFA